MTPTPLPPGQITDVVNAFEGATSAFQDFSLGMAALFILALFIMLLIIYVYSNRNSGVGTITLMKTFSEAMGGTLKERDERIDELETTQGERDEKYIESLAALSAASNRIADTFDLMHKSNESRDRVLSDLTSATTTLVTVGSKPLQQVIKEMGHVMELVEAINKRTSDWNDIIQQIPLIRKELNDGLDALMKEAAKRSTKPIPIITDTPASSEPDAGESELKAS
jgi:hypothetical protein